MSFGITKTIPASRGEAGINSFYDGSLDAFEFHMAGYPSKLKIGDFVYTIFNDELRGRLCITDIIGGKVNPNSGRPRSLIMVSCPGKKILKPIPRKGHRGTRYFDGADWK
jgi:hypothetical protein|tara:strand:+ start:4811 stop:5140 length:330 start_codon:yes stop_codon:yes gene_type:complete